MEPSVANLATIHRSGRHIVGWQGVRLVLPLDWEPGALSGDWSAGHVRIDQRLEPRFVVRWLADDSTRTLFRRSATRAEAIEQIATNYLDGLAREKKKKKHPIESRKTDRLLSRRRLDLNPVSFFEWECEREGTVGIGFTAECPTSGRVVIAELTGREPAELRSTAEWLWPDLRLGPESDDCVLWSAFDARIALPKSWRLTGSSLVLGKVEFRFTGEPGETLTLQRWTANLALGKGDLVEWAKKQLARDLRGEFLFRMERGRCHGHEAVLAEGTRRAPRERIAYAAKKLVRQDAPVHMRCRAWHCESENRIYILRTVGLESRADYIDEVAGRVFCHFEGS